jgi:hypothetical protein
MFVTMSGVSWAAATHCHSKPGVASWMPPDPEAAAVHLQCSYRPRDAVSSPPATSAPQSPEIGGFGVPSPYLRRLESSHFGSTDGRRLHDATSLPDAAEREGRLWIRHAEKTASPYLRFDQEGRDHNPAFSGQEALDGGTNLAQRW